MEIGVIVTDITALNQNHFLEWIWYHKLVITALKSLKQEKGKVKLNLSE